jgi:hypothetical protein
MKGDERRQGQEILSFWDENHEEKIESKEPKSQVPKKHAQST